MTTFDVSFTSKLSLYAAQTDFEKKQSMKSKSKVKGRVGNNG
ncbi:hypothetical protein CHCC14820_4355 [Bacillus paralicheniformis]|nr:hypothetical protein CHCC14820_4355 [Bacillus paralicheniformis]